MNSLGALTLTFAMLLGAPDAPWRELAPGLWRQASDPAAYVLVDGQQAIAFGAPADLDLATLEQRTGV